MKKRGWGGIKNRETHTRVWRNSSSKALRSAARASAAAALEALISAWARRAASRLASSLRRFSSLCNSTSATYCNRISLTFLVYSRRSPASLAWATFGSAGGFQLPMKELGSKYVWSWWFEWLDVELNRIERVWLALGLRNRKTVVRDAAAAMIVVNWVEENAVRPFLNLATCKYSSTLKRNKTKGEKRTY